MTQISKRTIKASEARVAEFFNTYRTPLSGINSRHTHSDTLHQSLYIETKYRTATPVFNWYGALKNSKSDADYQVMVIRHEEPEEGVKLFVDKEYFEDEEFFLCMREFKPIVLKMQGGVGSGKSSTPRTVEIGDKKIEYVIRSRKNFWITNLWYDSHYKCVDEEGKEATLVALVIRYQPSFFLVFDPADVELLDRKMDKIKLDREMETDE
jgi:hypothetical protein